MTEFFVSIFGIFIVSPDIVLRWRSRVKVLDIISDWTGLVSLPALAVIGGILSISCGWLGWALAVCSALGTVDCLNLGNLGNTDLEKSILIRAIMIAELVVLSLCLKTFLLHFLPVVSSYFGMPF